MFGLFGSNDNQWKYENLPTPLVTSDYNSLVEKIEKARLRILNSTSWKSIKNEGGVSIEEAKVEGSNIDAVRVVGFIDDVDFMKAVQLLFNPSYDERVKFQDTLLENTVVKVINSNAFVGKSVYKAPTGVSNREFVYFKTKKKIDDNRYLICTQSINFEDAPFGSGVTRGSCANVIEITKLSDTRIKISSVDHVDPRGWVPALMINSYKLKAADWIHQLQSNYSS